MRKPDVPTLLFAGALIVLGLMFYHVTLGRKKSK